MESANAAILASILAASVATLGLMLVAFRSGFAEKFSPYMASLAAGLLLATAVFLYPEALHTAEHASLWVIFGYIFLFSLNNIFDSENTAGRVLAPLLAIGLHSFVDGLEYGVLFSFDVYSALMASSGLILHEFAEAVVLYVLLRRANLGKWFAFILAFIGAALTTPLGTLTANTFVEVADPTVFGILVSIAVGALLYVGTTHLIDHVKDAENRSVSMLLYLVGVILAAGLAVTHSHGTDDDHDDHHDHHDEHAIELVLPQDSASS